MPSRHYILSLLAFNIIFLCIVNYVALPFLWYYLVWWFDMPMHFWGGLIVLLLVSYVFYKYIIRFSKLPVFYLVCSVFVIGIGWELFEYIVNNVIAGQRFSILDTLSDICFDVAGGIFALLLITSNRIYFSGNKKEVEV